MRAAVRVAIILGILLSTLALAPGAGAATARVEPPSGPPGTTFVILVTGLAPRTPFTCQFLGPDGAPEGLGPCAGEADAGGNIARNFTTAEGYIAAGTHSARFFGANGAVLAEATFIVGLSARRCFAETGQCIQGRFLEYWYERGALFFNGFPLSPEFTEVLEDGKPYTVQYFERVRLEYHPENAPPYDVLLGQFGRRIHPVDPPVPQQANAIYFPQTGHNVAGGFASFLAGVTSESPVGLEYFGYPISEAFRERLEDGNTYTVQYFERARLEEHPGGRILLGQFGRRFLPAQVPAGAGWLDQRPPPAWNAAGAAIPRAPGPIQPRDSYCPPVPQGQTPEDRLVAAAGWYVFTDDVRLGDVSIVLAEVGLDGMCRPLQFQAFVFVGGRFAGTLSPVPMDSRTDEALSRATIGADRATITAEYVRYDGSEPACCPSRISTAIFGLDRGVPLVQVRQVTTAPTRRAERESRPFVRRVAPSTTIADARAGTGAFVR